MGRKVHPVGFRLKSIRDWNARWYAEGGRYRDLLHEDIAIRRMVKQDLGAAGVAKVEIERAARKVNVTIHTARPGIVIGRKGAAVKDLRQKLKDLTGKTARVEVEEITPQTIQATVLGRRAGRAPDLQIKAVTYHQLKIEREGEGWRAEVFFDI